MEYFRQLVRYCSDPRGVRILVLLKTIGRLSHLLKSLSSRLVD
jgi:hypothetical protein